MSIATSGLSEMLRIDRLDGCDTRGVLRLEGEVVGPWVQALRCACDEVLAGHDRLVLDLEQVVFVDRAGIELFRELMKAGVMVMNSSPFVLSQLSG